MKLAGNLLCFVAAGIVSGTQSMLYASARALADANEDAGKELLRRGGSGASKDECAAPDPTDATNWTLCVEKCGEKLSLINPADKSSPLCPAGSGNLTLPWNPPPMSAPKPTVTYVAGQTIWMTKPGQNDARQIATCPENSYATGGGWLRLSGNMEANMAYDGPILDEESGAAVGWQVRLEAEGTGDWIESQTYVICITF